MATATRREKSRRRYGYGAGSTFGLGLGWVGGYRVTDSPHLVLCMVVSCRSGTIRLNDTLDVA